MSNIISLTLNPVVDKNTSVAGIQPHIKLRCAAPVNYPGGGGINVSRALRRLGADSLCMYLAGGATGIHLEELVRKEGLRQQLLRIEGWTRDNLAVLDTTSGLQYRFCVPGPEVSAREWGDTLKALDRQLAEGDYMVASGKLPPGIPSDFYVKVAGLCHEKGARMVLDTSGEALLKGAGAGVFLLKPNLSELSTLCGVNTITADTLEPLAKQVIADKACEILVVSLGARGALLVTHDTLEYVPAPIVDQKSTIGAGDSMVAGMVVSLLKGRTLPEMVRYGVACGTAATMRYGTELCHPDDVERLYAWMRP